MHYQTSLSPPYNRSKFTTDLTIDAAKHDINILLDELWKFAALSGNVNALYLHAISEKWLGKSWGSVSAPKTGESSNGCV